MPYETNYSRTSTDLQSVVDGTELVRNFSKRFKQDNPQSDLACSLEADGRRRQWQSLFMVPQSGVDDFEIEQLDLASHHLAQSWEALQQCLPDADKARKDDAPPDFETVLASVKQANEVWSRKREEGFGKAQRRMHAFCGTLYGYSDLLKILPQEEKYTSILSGSLSALVKASVTHETIADGLSQGLSEINEQVMEIRRQIRVLDNKTMRRIIIEVYALIFNFFNEVMTWFRSRWKRFRSSLDKNFYQDHILVWVEKIRERRSRLLTTANIEHQAMSKETNAISKDTNDLLHKFSSKALSRDDFEVLFNTQVPRVVDYRMKQLLLMLIGRNANQLLAGEEEICRRLMSSDRMAPDPQTGPGTSAYQDLPSDRVDAQKALIALNVPAIAENLKLTESDQAASVENLHKLIKLPSRSYSATAIQDSAKIFGGFADMADMSKLFAEAQNHKSSATVISGLRKWLSIDGSARLWIYGPAERGFPTAMSFVAASTATTALRVQIPVVVHFCKAESPLAGWGNPSEMSEERAYRLQILLYSVIQQLARLVPGTFESDLDFTRSRFASLDQSIHSIPAALSLLQDLRTVGPRDLFCIVDGLQWVATDEESDVNGYLGQFLDSMRIQVLENEVSSLSTRVLLTTPGICPFLISKFAVSERLNVISSMPRKDGRPSAGRRRLSSLQYKKPEKPKPGQEESLPPWY